MSNVLQTNVAGNPPSAGDIDIREQLFNDGAAGNITEVQVSTERITQLRGIMFDLDPSLYRISPILPAVPSDPPAFYEVVVKPWLQRHPVLGRAEVRNSGRGNHAILRFRNPVVFTSDEERRAWRGIVRTVQAALPIDPSQPDITAVTRAVGSVNSKNAVTVCVLKPGELLGPEEVRQLHHEMVTAPFRVVMNILLGADRSQPCPICRKSGSRLSALDHVGRCYGSCGTVKLQQLYDLVYAPRSCAGQEATR